METKKTVPILVRGLYVFGVILSLGFGFWHFFTPNIYQWLEYVSDDYISLERSIIWINFLFSFYLTVHSCIMLISFRKFHLMIKDQTFSLVYGWFLLIWIIRVIITIIWPFNGQYDWIFWLMISSFLVIVLIILIPFVFYISNSNYAINPKVSEF